MLLSLFEKKIFIDFQFIYDYFIPITHSYFLDFVKFFFFVHGSIKYQ